VQGGVHLLTGLLLASLSKRKEFKLGAVFGAILPDIDLVIAAVAYLAIGEKASVIHRSLTHSLLFLILVPGIIISLNFIPKIKNKKNYDFLGLGIGLFFGLAIHILIDMHDVFVWSNFPLAILITRNRFSICSLCQF